MHPFESLVVGIDGSAPGAAALGWAARRVPAGSLHVVHASDHGDPFDDAWLESARTAGSTPTLHSRPGDPARLLLQVADSTGADAIVVGAHGSGRRRSHFVGSVTRELLHESLIPVIVIDHEEAGSFADDHPVLVCVGYGDTARLAADWAADYAVATARPLLLLHVVTRRPLFPLDSPVDMLASYLGSDLSTELAESELETLRDEIGATHPTVSITTQVDHGSAVGSIIDAGSEAELVVIGKRQKGAVSRHIIGPRLQRLIARGGFPTVIVPAVDDDPADADED